MRHQSSYGIRSSARTDSISPRGCREAHPPSSVALSVRGVSLCFKPLDITNNLHAVSFASVSFVRTHSVESIDIVALSHNPTSHNLSFGVAGCAACQLRSLFRDDECLYSSDSRI
jgi:hypothetical protein